MLKDLEEDFAQSGGARLVEDHRSVYASAAKMVLSPRLKAFDVGQEKETVARRYGRSPFGQGCLLARRLVEAGVTFSRWTPTAGTRIATTSTVSRALSGTVDRVSPPC